jgi:arylsulfatase A-like enzyme/Tfp pilus assembly protein PilF
MVVRKGLGVAWLAIGLVACQGPGAPPAREVPPAAAAPQIAILLVTLDTTRADSIGPANPAVETPALSALAARGLRFTRAYATAPQTLPSHVSMLTGLYPAGHGVRENGRRLGRGVETVAQRLERAGYATAAFVSGFPLTREFGLERGFETYDDELGSSFAERAAPVTTSRAVAWLEARGQGPVFLWVHYYEPHEPYAPPEPYRSRYSDPYLGEVAAMDASLGRLVGAFLSQHAGGAVLVVGDHGESRGEHGEAFHGSLLYDGAMRVPLVLAGSGVPAGVRDEPVSTRRVADTIAAWAGLGGERSLARAVEEPVLGEAMQPYVHYGWQPQVLVVSGRFTAIRSGRLEVYDTVADPRQEHDLADPAGLDAASRQAIRDYPVPTPDATRPENLDRESLQRLASLGYITGGTPPRLRPDAPRAADMTRLFAELDRASGLFVAERYAEAIPVLEDVLRQDPRNVTIALRLAVAHSALGHDRIAERYFEEAARIEPDSIDLLHYRAMHAMRAGRFADAGPLFERVLAAQPERLPAIRGLAQARERQGRLPEAAALLRHAADLESDPTATLAHLGELAMATGDTATAVGAYERLRSLQGGAFDHDLELGVLYLDQRRLDAAAASLDRVRAGDPRYPLALFKRAQASVLLGEPDRDARVRAAYRAATAQTRALIERESLFRGIAYR